ncbi:MFS transporter [Nesterenkonia xinjiangensis]|uniref:Putative MFS family arabinose efflux permease n=1 Tax=Nesterenkonia xinjiangensis TaxID=225327 RepID=A0A7Z0K8Z9_9MICC|nr:putative MFS family arabinose efflux permease [Nesterenkonia xinjiangensis]
MSTRLAPPTPLAPLRTVRLAAAGLALIAVCYGLARFAYGLFVPVFRTEFDLDGSQVGLIGSASYAAYCVAICAAMMLAPRWGGRAVAVMAGVAATLGIGLVGASQGPAMLSIGVILAGASTGMVSPPLAFAVAKRVEARRQDRVQAIINAGTGLGVALSGPVALLTLDHWRGAWLVFTVIAAATTVWAACVVPDSRTEPEERTPGSPAAARGSTGRLVPAPLLPPGAMRLLLSAGLAGMSTTAVWVFGRDVLTQVGGISDVAATLTWSLLGAAGLLGAGVGDLVRRVGPRGAWVLITGLLAASTAVFGVVPGELLPVVVAASAFGAAYIAMTGLLLINGVAVYSGHPSAGVGLAFLVLALGQSVGGAVLGRLMEAADAETAFLAAAGLALLCALMPPVPTSVLVSMPAAASHERVRGPGHGQWPERGGTIGSQASRSNGGESDGERP